MKDIFNKKIDDSYTSQIVEEILNDEDVKELARKRNFSEADIQRNLSTFVNWKKRLINCKNCKGLDDCKNDPNGYQYEIREDLYDVLTPCRFYKDRESKLGHKKNYLICDLADKNLTTSLETINLKDETKYYRSIVELLMEWLDNETEKGFYIQGGLGVGKSYLAACLTNELARNGKKVAFVNFPTLCSDIRNNITEPYYVDRKIRAMKSAYLLVIDDIGAENISSYIRDDVLFTILDYRMEHDKRTIFTSNCVLDKLESRFVVNRNGDEDQIKAARIIERIKALIDCELPMDGNSRRFK